MPRGAPGGPTAPGLFDWVPYRPALFSQETEQRMKLAIGIDVHKNLCAAHAVNGGVNQPRKKHLDLIEGFNAEFRRFPSDVRGLGRLARYVSGHDVHILIENSTKSHDVYWILRGFGLNVTVAH